MCLTWELLLCQNTLSLNFIYFMFYTTYWTLIIKTGGVITIKIYNTVVCKSIVYQIRVFLEVAEKF